MIASQSPQGGFWRGKRVLVTGHTGFKGAWLTFWLNRLGAEVTGIGLAPETTPNLFELLDIPDVSKSHFCDIRDYHATSETLSEARPEVVLHLAAQALVRMGYQDPITTFNTNVLGTANILEALRAVETVRVVVAITTDKVYEDQPPPHAYVESDALGGHDPYSASKAAAEMVIGSYRDAYFSPRGVALASARAGNVIGGGDWAEDRLIPDAFRAWSSEKSIVVRRPDAVRPWQHVLESLGGYLTLAERLWSDEGLAGAFNFGPETPKPVSVREVVELARTVYGVGEISWGDGAEGPPEACWLALDVSKARSTLGIRQRWPLDQTVRRTMGWYRGYSAGKDPQRLCSDDIDAFEVSSQMPAAP